MGRRENGKKDNFVALLGPSSSGQTVPARLFTALYFLVYFYSIIERADRIASLANPTTTTTPACFALALLAFSFVYVKGEAVNRVYLPVEACSLDIWLPNRTLLYCFTVN